jgi:toxin YoeB
MSLNSAIKKKVAGNLEGAYSHRINIQYRLVYQVYENELIVKVIRLWTHYD